MQMSKCRFLRVASDIRANFCLTNPFITLSPLILREKIKRETRLLDYFVSRLPNSYNRTWHVTFFRTHQKYTYVKVTLKYSHVWQICVNVSQKSGSTGNRILSNHKWENCLLCVKRVFNAPLQYILKAFYNKRLTIWLPNKPIIVEIWPK